MIHDESNFQDHNTLVRLVTRELGAEIFCPARLERFALEVLCNNEEAEKFVDKGGLQFGQAISARSLFGRTGRPNGGPPSSTKDCRGD